MTQPQTAGFIHPFQEVTSRLSSPIDPRLIKQREGWRDRYGNVQTVDYIEWHTVADILDNEAPGWESHVVRMEQVGDIMTVTLALTINGVTREGIGTGNTHNEMGIKKAEHDALKRAAVKFGVGRDLYRKEAEHEEREGSANGYNQPDGFPTQPIARNLSELVTAKQLGFIRALARELQIDPDEECNAVMNCRIDELTKAAAGSFITHLQNFQKVPDIVADSGGTPYAPPSAQSNMLPPPPVHEQSPNLPPGAYQRSVQGVQAPSAPPTSNGTAKPNFGGVTGPNSKPASQPQLNALAKIAPKHGLTVDDLVRAQFNDIQSGTQLSSWGASFLIDQYGNKR